jgi:hypothetical protein
MKGVFIMDQKKNDQDIVNFLHVLQNKYDGLQYHNVGIIQSVDRNGNVTNQKYFCNLLTTWIFVRLASAIVSYHGTNNMYYTGTVYIGSNDDNQTHTYDQTQLFNKINMEPTVVSRDDSSTVGRDHSVTGIYRYDSANGIASQLIKSLQVYFDYNYSGFDSPVAIRELGLSTTRSNYSGTMLTLSDVYDMDGNKSEIIKNPNERLYIQYYLNSILEKRTIDRLWNKGVYYLSQPAATCVPPCGNGNGDDDYFSQRTYLITRDDLYNNGLNVFRMCFDSDKYSMNDDNTIGTYTNTKVDITFDTNNQHNCTELLVGSSNETGSNYTYNPSFSHLRQLGYFRIFYKRLQRETPEEIEAYNIWTNYYDSKYFEDVLNISYNSFYGHGLLPFAQFDCQQMKYFSYDDLDYTQNQAFINSPQRNYSKLWTKTPTWFVANGQTYYIYAYPDCEEITVTGLNNIGVTYVTDNYLDLSSYQQLEDNANIPLALQNKRYFIRKDTTALSPIIQENKRFQLSIDHTYVDYDYTIKSNFTVLHTSDEYGWVLTNADIIFPEHMNDSGSYVEKLLHKLEELWVAKLSMTEAEHANGAWTTFHNHVHKYYDGKYIVLLMVDTTATAGMHFYNSSNAHSTKGKCNCLVRLDMSKTTIDEIVNSATICWWDNYTSTHNELTNDHTICIGDYDESSHYRMIADTTNGRNTLICDIDTMEDFYIDNSYNPHFIYGTTYIGYWDSATSTHLTIYDLETKSVVQEYDLPDLDQYTYGDFIGLHNMIYIKTIPSGGDPSFLMVLNTDDRTYARYTPPTNFVTGYSVFEKWNTTCHSSSYANLGKFALLTPNSNSPSGPASTVIENLLLTNSIYHMAKFELSQTMKCWHDSHAFIHYIKDTHQNNDFIVYYDSMTLNYQYGTSSNSKTGSVTCILTRNNPLNVIYLYNQFNSIDKKPSGLIGYGENRYNTLYHIEVRWIDSSYFVALQSPQYTTIVDIGEIIHKGNGLQLQEFYAIGHFPIGTSNDYSTIRSNSGVDPFVAYKNGYVYRNNNIIRWIPIEQLRHYYVKGTTITISSFNNPFKISNLGCSLSLTNRMDLYPE